MTAFIATYRMQLGPSLRFADVASLASYLERLGISHVYLSPIASASPGSAHGYDVVDPMRVSLELGGEDGLRRMRSELAARGIGVVIDTVPNHMACSSHNKYWEDVLTHGLHSRYARWFDIDWEDGRPILLPVLGDDLDSAIARGEITLAPDRGRIRLTYFDESFPLDPRCLPDLFAAAGLQHLSDSSAPLAGLPPPLDTSAGTNDTRAALAESCCAGLAVQIVADESEIAAALLRLTSSDIAHFVGAQAYRLELWRKANRRGSYRRFFDINQLVALDLGTESALSAILEVPRRLSADDSIDGVRVDHIDGLADPVRYLSALREAVGGQQRRIWVEKILEPNEQLRETWPVDGTTGYDFIALSEPLFVDPAGADRIERYFRERTGEKRSFETIVASAKKRALLALFGADLRRLATRLRHLEIPTRALLECLTETISALPVYRTYAAPSERVSDMDAQILSKALRDAAARKPPLSDTLSVIEGYLLSSRGRQALLLLQQISGPAMAKGVEDTAFYRFFPLSSLCEVGSSPDLAEGDPLARFHAGSLKRADSWPFTMNALSTHDTKRSADARARISALSETPDDWISFVERWRERHSRIRPRTVSFRSEIALYQALFAIWDGSPACAVVERAKSFCKKALRESKDESSWLCPNNDREEALDQFVEFILENAYESGFGDDLDALVGRVEEAASAGALARIALQMLSPGMPDIYMGDEAWRLSLVDPDNRRPVSWPALETALSAADRMFADVPGCARKTWLVHRLLRLRRERSLLFAEGSYEPLSVSGPANEHLVAFRRVLGEETAVVAVSRLTLSAMRRGVDLSASRLAICTDRPLVSYLDGLPVESRDGQIALGPHLGNLAVAVLLSPLASARRAR